MSAKLAYVTGGMGGIGTAICQRLAKEGMTVVAGCGPSRDYGQWLAEQALFRFVGLLPAFRTAMGFARIANATEVKPGRYLLVDCLLHCVAHVVYLSDSW